MVAVGNLKKIWLEIPQYFSEEEFNKAFEDYFCAKVGDVMDTADKSFEYNVYNTVYFSVGDIELIENVTLDGLLEEKGMHQPPNVVVS